MEHTSEVSVDDAQRNSKQPWRKGSLVLWGVMGQGKMPLMNAKRCEEGTTYILKEASQKPHPEFKN